MVLSIRLSSFLSSPIATVMAKLLRLWPNRFFLVAPRNPFVFPLLITTAPPGKAEPGRKKLKDSFELAGKELPVRFAHHGGP
jgi:predicted MFS family arabinose efflux permease